MQIIYFDHNSTTKLEPRVLDKMQETYQLPLNSSSTHQLGQKANGLVENARDQLKKILNAKNYEVIFTGSATESINTVISGSEAKIVLFCEFEHSATYNCRPENKKIIEVNSTKSGIIDIKDLEEKLQNIKEPNFLLSILFANSETGSIQPILELSKLVHQKGGLIHLDASQAAGKIAIDLEKLNVDFASLSSHKFGGPQGVGAILIRKGLDLKPLIFGGGQEKSKRSGTLNIAGIAGFGKACEIANENLTKYQNIADLRDFLENELKKIAGEDIKIFSTEVDRLPNTSYISIKNSDAQTQIMNFDLNGICISTGSACSSGTISESRTLKAMKVTPEFIKGAIRISLGKENTRDEILKFIAVFTEFYQRTKGK